MTTGDITPEVLIDWFNACENYFTERDTPDDKRVAKVLGGLQDVLFKDWYSPDRARITALSWTEFIKEVKSEFLSSTWVEDARNKLLSMRQRDTDAFKEFSNRFEKANAILRNTNSHLTDEKMIHQMEVAVCDDLQALVKDERARLSIITKYRQWRKEVCIIDDRRIAERDRMTRFLTHSGKNNKSSRSTTPNNATSSRASTSKPIPKLTDAERDLLRKNEGCFKCRKFFAGHIAGQCTTWPDPNTYRTLTATDATAARTNHPNTTVAAITDLNSVNTTAVAAVRAISPLAATSGVLGNGTDSSDDEYVDTPLFVPHLLWQALILNPNGHTLPRPTTMLIDGGCPTVLIREDVASSFELRRFCLLEPQQLGNAWGEENKVATEWVKLNVSSVCSSWSSRMVRAIVAPRLCAPVLLGRPFLKFNDIDVDHRNDRVIYTPTGLDLLHIPIPMPPPITLTPQQRRNRLAEEERKQNALREEIRNRWHQQLLQGLMEAAKGGERQKRIRTFDNAWQAYQTKSLNLGKVIYDNSSPVDSNHLKRSSYCPVAAVREQVEELAFTEQLKQEDANLKRQYVDRFPEDIPHIDELPTDVYHRIRLKDANLVISRRQYDCPKKYREVWKTLLTQHIQAGRLRPSASPYASPSFLIPKSDPTALPRWVNDYRALNDNTIPDRHPLPSINTILSDCAKGKIWGKLDMTNSFFQTRVHPDDIPYTAVTTPFGLYEWLVMPQGGRNAPATHQRRMFNALRPLIGSICHVYLDDIIIWSDNLESHRRNVEKVLDALREHHLYASLKKTTLFAVELDFLGHHISRRGIEADPKKVERILNWPIPRSSSDVRAFLGLVRYVASFLPNLAEYTSILTPLTTKPADKVFPEWTQLHQRAFDQIKSLVLSRDCLTTINHDNHGDNKIFVACDASDKRTGAVLTYGPTKETARPVAFESTQLKGAELNYPVHEKELLAILRALKKWRVDLLGETFTVFTDHRTLTKFKKQKDLSRRQSRWQEEMGQYDFEIVYVGGETNEAADALSRLPDDCDLLLMTPVIATVHSLKISAHPEWLQRIKEGYKNDSWCRKLNEATSFHGIRTENDLWYVGNRLIIPRVREIREGLFRLAHDSRGHFGFDKSYAALRDCYYWPNMRKEIETMYIPSCESCQRNKSSTTSPTGPLHPLPVPQNRGDCIAIDFVGPLPEDDGFNCIVAMTDRLGADVRIVPTRTDISAEEFAAIFFEHWYCENGLPLEIVSDRDTLFVNTFWKTLHKLTGVKLRMSTAFHPQTDGSSERTNKTIIQSLRFYVSRNQRGWAQALPKVRFDIMNSMNTSTGFSPFQLHMGRSPRLIPPLTNPTTDSEIPAPEQRARNLIHQLQSDVATAQDNLTAAKINQTIATNARRGAEIIYKPGDQVLLSTMHRRRDYMRKGEKRVAKFLVRYDGPYKILRAYPESSVYTLDLPQHMNIFPTFHASLLKPWRSNDAELFPTRQHSNPGPILTEDGIEEWEVDSIVDRRRRGRGWQYLVRWKGWGPEADDWLPGKEVEELEALDVWLALNRDALGDN